MNYINQLKINTKETMVLVILAAGMGSRYGGLKQLDVVSNTNESIIDFSLFDAINAGFKKVVFVVRKDILQQAKDIYNPKLKGKIEVVFVCQELDNIPKEFKNNNRKKPWGTAHALLVAKDVITNNFCVINADDFYGKDAFLKMAQFLKEVKPSSNNYSMIGYHIENTLSENGSVSRGECIVNNNCYLKEVYERTSISKNEEKIIYIENDKQFEIKEKTIVSMNFWGFTPQIFVEIENQFYQFLKENFQTEKEEFYLPLVINNLLENQKATVKVIETTSQWMGVTYKEDKESVVLKIEGLKQKGIYPEKLWS